MDQEQKCREIIKKISDAAIELAFTRHDLKPDTFDPSDYISVKESVASLEEEIESIKVDVLNCLTGDDTGCLDESELSAENCELLWLRQRLRGPFHAEATLRKM